MILFPAVDIKDGKVIRLEKGDFAHATEYGDDPIQVAKQWQDLGARWLHVVDLDGAKTGKAVNKDVVKAMVKELDIPLQIGGGIRYETQIVELLEAGVARVILGTKVVEDDLFLKNVLKKWPDQVAVSLDCRDGYIATKGWVEKTNIRAVDFVKSLEAWGLQYLIYTDIVRDGMLTGPNFEQLEMILGACDIPVISSGGIKSLEHIGQLKEYEKAGVIGAITGKAIYEGTLDLKAALALC